VEVLGIRLRRHPVDSRSTCFTRVAVCLAQNVFVDKVGQRREHPTAIVGGLRGKALEWWCDGW
jgi:hypothetical protein